MMKFTKKLFIVLTLLSLYAQPTQALEKSTEYACNIFMKDLQSFYEGRNFEFQNKSGKNITKKVKLYKKEYLKNPKKCTKKLFNIISSYGETKNKIMSQSIKNNSYTWKNYRIKITNTTLIIANITVSASYNTATKKIIKPQGKLSHIKYIGICNIVSTKLSTSYLNNKKTIRYLFNITVKHTSGRKTVKVAKNWTPHF